MSEYQYYEFRSIDRSLTAKEREELESLSSRAEVTSHSFSNEYSYGNFRGNPGELMERYFDAHLYMANWGSNRLAFRLPRGAVDVAAFAPYFEDCEHNKMTVSDEHVVVWFEGHLEGGAGWISGEGVIEDLLPLREQLLAGDLRCLYLAWLADATGDMSDIDDRESVIEPPVPPGLNKLDKPLKAFVEHVFLDEDILAAAAQSSGKVKPGPEPAGLRPWLASQSDARKTDWLEQLLGEDSSSARHRILGEYRRSGPGQEMGTANRRTLAELRTLAGWANEDEEQDEEEREPDREVYLNSLSGQEPRMWNEITALVDSRKAASYDQAVKLLRDLSDFADAQNYRRDFDTRLAALVQANASKSAFLRRLQEAALWQD